MACEDLQTRYNALAAAYDTWLTKGGIASIRHGEEMTQYGPMDGKTLRAELARAKDALAVCNGTTTARRRILRVLPI